MSSAVESALARDVVELSPSAKREHTEAAMKSFRDLARDFKDSPRQDQANANLHALYEHSKQIAPALLGAMQDFVEQHGGDFVCPPPVYKVPKGTKIEEAQFRETVKEITTAQCRVRSSKAPARMLG